MKRKMLSVFIVLFGILALLACNSNMEQGITPAADVNPEAVESSPQAMAHLAHAGFSPENLAIKIGGEGSKTYVDYNACYAQIIAQSGDMYLLEVNLRPGGGCSDKTSVLISCYYAASTSGWLLNIGDSITNDGYGGDAGTQSCDAESYVINNGVTSYLHAHENEYDGCQRFSLTSGHIPATGYRNVRYWVENNMMSVDKNFDENWEYLNTNYFYALDGRYDAEGPEDYKIYIGINRVIGGTYRSGSGLDYVYVYLY